MKDPALNLETFRWQAEVLQLPYILRFTASLALTKSATVCDTTVIYCNEKGWYLHKCRETRFKGSVYMHDDHYVDIIQATFYQEHTTPDCYTKHIMFISRINN